MTGEPEAPRQPKKLKIEALLGGGAPVGKLNGAAGSPPKQAEIDKDPIYRALKILELLREGPRPSTMGVVYDIRCPWADEHTGGMDGDTSTSYVPVLGRFSCLHGHCDRRTTADLRQKLDEMLEADSDGLCGMRHLVGFDEFDEVADREPETGGGSPWQLGWQHTGKNGSGGPASNLFNVMVALRRAPEFEGSFGFNDFTSREILHRELPGVRPGTTPGVPREWRDVDTILLQTWLQGQGLRLISTRMVDSAVHAIMREKAHHPVRDWLKGLVWDGVPRLDTWLSRYLGTPDDPYHAHVGRWWLMTMCMRVFEPGCRADYMVVLEGPQGREKSSFLRALAVQPKWFSDQLPNIGSKDASEHLVGCWLIEIAEMDRFDRTESSQMKAFLSRTTERYRRAYGQRTGDEPRQCVYAGTVNHKSYLKDETGNRRYWPVEVGIIDLAGLILIRDQLFAEALNRAVVEREQYWPDALFEDLFMQPQQDARLEADLWEPLVVEFLATKKQALVYEVVIACTGGGSMHLNTTNRNRVTRIMETLCWKRGKRGPNGEKFWYPL